MDDVKLMLKADAYAQKLVAKFFSSTRTTKYELEMLMKQTYIVAFRAGELEASARRTETEEKTT